LDRKSRFSQARQLHHALTGSLPDVEAKKINGVLRGDASAMLYFTVCM
jgi:hypothetical protein